jgi:SMI1 / KNR4 family (SUKH-1)
MDRQDQRENVLIERLKEIIQTSRHATGEPTWRPQRKSSPVTEEELLQAEAQLDFVLPALLRRIYLEVGNGSFGPGYGLLPLNEIPPNAGHGLDSLVTAYQAMRAFSQKDIDQYFAEEDEKPALWPERVLILCDWGCNIYSCLDCSASDLPIFRMDSNENFLVAWAIEASSLQQWLATWVDEAPGHLDWEHATKVSVSLLGKHTHERL